MRQKQEKKRQGTEWSVVLLLSACLLFVCLVLSSCQKEESKRKDSSPSDSQAYTWEQMEFLHSLKLQYANQFSVDYYEGGFKLITIVESGKYLIVPEGMEVPSGIPKKITVIQEPLSNIYLAATSAMDLICHLDSLSQVTLSGTNTDGWYIKEAREAMERGELLYAGKYNAPDYERILSSSCDLAVESTMIFHSPEV